MTKTKKDDRDKYIGEDKLPEGYRLADLIEFYDIGKENYSKARKRMEFLDGMDSGRFWEVLDAKLPKYQIKPDTNHINRLKENILTSIYNTDKSAFLIPKQEADKALCRDFNSVIGTIWKTINVGKFQRLAGERAALLNLGITKVGWDNSKRGSKGSFYKGQPVLKNISPMKFMKDPFADNLDDAAWTLEWDNFHKSYLKRNKVYGEEFIKYEKRMQQSIAEDPGYDRSTSPKDGTKDPRSGYYRVYLYYLKVDGDVWEIHTLNNEFVLNSKKCSVKEYPYAELYCNLPGEDILGSSEPAKVLANAVTSNVMLSILCTHAYKTHRPAKFLDTGAGLNIRAFAKSGNDPDKLFLTNTKASDAVHYAYPEQLPRETYEIPNKLGADMQYTSGVDDRYQGKDTGSITTTGGIEAMLGRATMIDSIKIANYEEYTAQLTKLIVKNLVEYGDKRTYKKSATRENVTQFVEIDFSKLDSMIEFDYGLNISASLPANKTKLSQVADMLMEKQAQYQPNPALITMEEYLMLKDLPYELKELMNERIDIQNNTQISQQVMQTLTTFAQLIEQGVDPNQAMEMTVQSLQQQEQPGGGQSAPKLGNVGAPSGPGGTPAGSPQARQIG